MKKIFQSKGSAALLMNINNGEILSLVSLPDFNINKRNEINDEKFINRITKGVYELGSIFKTFTLAGALNEKIIETRYKSLKIYQNQLNVQEEKYLNMIWIFHQHLQQNKF